MNVLLLNGSAHAEGSTASALSLIAGELEKNGVDSTIFQLGAGPVHGCVGCFKCRTRGHCVFQDDILPALVAAVEKADAIIIGTPVYYAGPSGALCAVLDRLFFSAGSALAKKPAAAVAVCRRAGATAAIDRLNKYFTINQMPVVSSTYWNMCRALTPDELARDSEGLKTLATLADNMAALLKQLAK